MDQDSLPIGGDDDLGRPEVDRIVKVGMVLAFIVGNMIWIMNNRRMILSLLRIFVGHLFKYWKIFFSSYHQLCQILLHAHSRTHGKGFVDFWTKLSF
jgi:hypothetical protein